MNDRLFLDTHVWIWLELAINEKLADNALSRIRRAANADTLYIAAISLHEVAYGASRKRIDLKIGLEDWFVQAFKDPSPTLLPLNIEIAVASASLPPGFHGDPADRLLAATAIVHQLVLCTHDEALLRFGRRGLYEFLEI